MKCSVHENVEHVHEVKSCGRKSTACFSEFHAECEPDDCILRETLSNKLCSLFHNSLVRVINRLKSLFVLCIVLLKYCKSRDFQCV